MTISGILELKDTPPLFDNGRHRVIFRHPQNPDLIVKIVRHRWAERYERYNALKKRFKQLRENVYNIYEFLETMRLNFDTNLKTPHVLTTLGIVRTDLGWGMVCEIEKDKDGSPARTIKDIGDDIKHYVAELKVLSDWAESSPVVLTSFHADNLVLSWRDDHYEFVMIDGLGERNILRLRTYIRSLNRKENMKRLHKMLNDLHLYNEVLGK
ncbi:hypothetical protein H3S89_09330 [Bartonella sp. B10834G6]|uniref:YrbL family protein n=1 Tax=Bartonella apis TaxID=1686310 RepID=UPI0018DCB066|nr:YrbL family protein [Bartonella apis]MBH9982990.1 hypothetical protein [Bartonella apis]